MVPADAVAVAGVNAAVSRVIYTDFSLDSTSFFQGST